MLDQDDQEFEHPSYGMVSFSRSSVGGKGWRIFGSGVRTNHPISLRITKAKRSHHLNQDWYHGGIKEIIEVNMTESQFAQLITSLNQGEGVPCTISYLGGKIIERPDEEDKSEAELVHETFKQQAAELSKKLSDSVKQVKDIALASKMTQKDKQAICGAVERFENHARSHMPFLLSQLHEAADRVVTQVKTEVMAWTDRTLKAAGLGHMIKDAPQMIEHKEKHND